MRRSSIDERAAAQAVELVRALRDQLQEMTYHLAWLERQDVIGLNGRASAIRCEAAALRLDISEAQFFIDRLQRRYLNSDGTPRTAPTARSPNVRGPPFPVRKRDHGKRRGTRS